MISASAAFCLACQLVFLFAHLNEHKLSDEVENRILREDVLPHIGNAVFVRKHRISLACVHAGAVAHVERQEERIRAGELGRHIDLVQVHREIDEHASLK